MPDLISFDYACTKPFIKDHEISQMEPFIHHVHEMIHQGTGVGKEWLGWVDLPLNNAQQEMNQMKETANWIRSNSDVLIVIGIGGSYLGTRAILEMLGHPFYNSICKSKDLGPEIYFAGHNLSSDYLKGLFDLLEDKEICINVISKSGTTTEPAIAFRIFRDFMKRRYGSEMNKRIFATTDAKDGILKKLADEEGYTTFIIPDNIGGRYSVLTPVGLLPLAVAGINIEELIEGAGEVALQYRNKQLIENHCYQYAAIRNILHRKGKEIELFANYSPHLFYFSEWWKQLYGESEGKDAKGIFPAAVHFTTDLHSMGQYIQDGLRNLFETVLYVEKSNDSLFLPIETNDLDGLNYMANKDLDVINFTAFQGTLQAHIDGGVPVSVLKVGNLTPKSCGGLIYFFQKACALSGYLLGINPFDQPGVEVYKKNMFDLLGKSSNTLHIY